MFSLAIEAGKLAYRPMIPMLKEMNARTAFFEAEQFGSLCRHLPDALQPLVRFMYLTGWRRGEVTRLEWRQVDFRAGEVRLAEAEPYRQLSETMDRGVSGSRVPGTYPPRLPQDSRSEPSASRDS